MNSPQIWILIGIVLIIAELFTPGFFLSSLGIGAIAAGLVSFLSESTIVQLLVFALVTAASLFILRPLLLRISKDGKEKSGIDALIAEEGIVIEEIDNIEGKGRVKVKGQEWKARCADGKNIAKGDVIIVTGIEGVTLSVTRR